MAKFIPQFAGGRKTVFADPASINHTLEVGSQHTQTKMGQASVALVRSHVRTQFPLQVGTCATANCKPMFTSRIRTDITLPTDLSKEEQALFAKTVQEHVAALNQFIQTNGQYGFRSNIDVDVVATR